MRRRVAVVLTLAFCAAGLAAAAPRGVAPAPEPTAALRGRLRASGRAEASFTRSRVDPLGGGAQRTRGTLVLELPMRVLLRFPETGEKIALREDGGEWLQPRLGQMLVLGTARAADARRWWDALLGVPGAGVRATPRGARRYDLVLGSSAAGEVDRATVTLDSRGLPRALEIDEGEGEPTQYRFDGWRFAKARGGDAFRLTAPSGVEVVDLR